MINYELFCQLRQLHDEKGLNACQIAAELNLDIKTVKRWIGQPTYQQRQGTHRASKLDSAWRRPALPSHQPALRMRFHHFDHEQTL